MISSRSAIDEQSFSGGGKFFSRISAAVWLFALSCAALCSGSPFRLPRGHRGCSGSEREICDKLRESAAHWILRPIIMV
jgi:hypothetical protein